MPRGKHTLKPRRMKQIRRQAETNYMRVKDAQARREKQAKIKRKAMEEQSALEAQLNNEQRRQEQAERIARAINRG